MAAAAAATATATATGMSDEEVLEAELIDVGTKLLNPPSALHQLLSLLDQLETFLLKVDQSPSHHMLNALSPALKSLVADQLFNHSHNDVKAAVASCISEITRITAPEAPYNDRQMEKVFHLFVSTFQNLSDQSSRSFTKRTSILETVAKVRSCVVMLDLECDSLITEMFQHFYKSIRDDHPENVFTSMETIMTLVIEESEDISLELLSLLLAPMKKSNKEVLPIARKLGETVLKNCCEKVKPYLAEALQSRSISPVDYNEVVASICEELGPFEQNGVHAATEHVVDETNADRALDDEAEVEKKIDPKEDPSEEEGNPCEEKINPSKDGDKSPKSAVINGVTQTVEYNSLTEVDSTKKQDTRIPDVSKSADAPSNPEPNNNTESVNKTELDINTEPDNLSSKKVEDAETKEDESTQDQCWPKATISIKVRGPSPGPKENVDKESKKLLVDERSKDTPSSGMETENEKDTSEDSRAKNDLQKNEKGDLNIEAVPSPEDNVTNLSEENWDLEAKSQKVSVENEPISTSDEDKSTELSKETRDLEAIAQKSSVEKEPICASNEDKSPILSDSSKKGRTAKRSVRFVRKASPSTVDIDEKPSVETAKSSEETAKLLRFNKMTSPSTVDNAAKPSEETTKKGSGKKAPASSSKVDKSKIISETRAKKGVQGKKKGKMNKEATPSSEDNSAKLSDETMLDADDTTGKTKKVSGKKATTGISDETMLDADDTTGKTQKMTGKKVAAGISDETMLDADDTTGKTQKVTGKKAAACISDETMLDADDTTGKTQKVSGKKAAAGISDETMLDADDTKGNTQKVSGKEAANGISDETILDASTKESVDTTDTELKSLANKVDEDGEGSGEGENKNSHSGGEQDSERTASADEDDKEMVSSLKPGKSIKKVTPKTNSKRKRSPVADKASINEYGDNLVGSKVKVWWPQDKAYYKGVIDSYDSVKQKHRVLYNDGDEEVLNLKRQKWELITAESEVEQDEAADEPQPESSSELPLKKMKPAASSSSKAKKVASSSKSKATTSARKSEDDSKAKGKPKDSKAATAKSKTENSTPKSSKAKNGDSEKSKASMSKEEDAKTSAKSKKVTGKLKVDTPKASTPKASTPKASTPKASGNSKGKATKGSGKSNSKVKEIDDANENSDDSLAKLVLVKGKSPGGSKGTGTKSGKKRPRSSRS
ncbi:hypothetical protein ACFE04_008427 [Oxalis oulophora]